MSKSMMAKISKDNLCLKEIDLRGEVYSIQHHVIKFVSDLQQVGGFLRFPPPRKLTVRHDITEKLLKVALNPITKSSSINTVV
jgi:hypothetical protein